MDTKMLSNCSWSLPKELSWMQKMNLDGLHLCLLVKMDTKMLSNCSWTIPKELIWMQEIFATGALNRCLLFLERLHWQLLTKEDTKILSKWSNQNLPSALNLVSFIPICSSFFLFWPFLLCLLYGQASFYFWYCYCP